jgi:hypothetical protein
MSEWEGKRRIYIATAHIRPDGAPDFTLNDVEVTQDEYLSGVHVDLVEDILAQGGFDEPFIHFSSVDAPSFLIPAVKAYLEASPSGAEAKAFFPF